jgi:hypothetical protein
MTKCDLALGGALRSALQRLWPMARSPVGLQRCNNARKNKKISVKYEAPRGSFMDHGPPRLELEWVGHLGPRSGTSQQTLGPWAWPFLKASRPVALRALPPALKP